MPKHTIVIGTGISAVAYLATMPAGEKGDGRTVMGGSDLWRRMPGLHNMGQQEPLLTGNLLPGQRNFAAPPRPGAPPFLTAARFTDLLNEELGRANVAHIPDSIIDVVRRRPEGGYMVEGPIPNGRYALSCDQVVLAMGPGPVRLPTHVVDDQTVDMGTYDGRVIGGTAFLSPHWKLPDNLPKAATFAVYGGSATAAWVVEQALARGLVLTKWFTRASGSKFSEAFPPGERNSAVEKTTEKLRELAGLIGVAPARADDPTSDLVVRIDSQLKGRCHFDVNILVYALGSDHNGQGGIPTIVHRDIHKDLVAFYDHNHSISDAAPLLALGTEDRSLMIVGAAMQSKGGFSQVVGMRMAQKDVKKTLDTVASYKDISLTLPPAARPPEGIAMVMAGIEALTDYIPAKAVPGHTAWYSPKPGVFIEHATRFSWDINVNTSNRTQLAAWLAQSTELTPYIRSLGVALIVALRSGVTVGLAPDQVETILRRAVDWTKQYETHFPNIQARHLEMDTLFHDDTFVLIHVKHLTTDKWQVANWQRLGIAYVPPPSLQVGR